MMLQNILMVVEVIKNRSYIRLKGYQSLSGEAGELKIGTITYDLVPFYERGFIQIEDASVRPKKKVDGRWIDSPTEKEVWLK